ncbi:vacuolar protein-sorting-associated protein 25 [Centruroides vittatus]|uniref:vacuolar protein-sorting-associated protein 25 n=1 Tax=Centruroides vittatus TaxID=120091 RepID=UPI00351047C6
MADFEWPWQYNFPPFFTIQPNRETRTKQLEAWKELIVRYYRVHKKYIMDLTEAQSSPLFNNKDIERSLSIDEIYIILDSLQKQGNLEWLDKQKQRCFIYWRTPEEWAKLIYNWIDSRGMKGTVCTLYELTNGDDVVNEEFYELDEELLVKALQLLQYKGRAELINFGDSQGVKFF